VISWVFINADWMQSGQMLGFSSHTIYLSTRAILALYQFMIAEIPSEIDK